MRALVIDEDARSRVRLVRDFAEKSENLYIVADGFSFQKPPGDDPRHVCELNTFRCVFSITRAQGKLWRHLSISVPSKNYPNPFAAFTIAELFGFTGWDGESTIPPRDWAGKVAEEEHAIALAQEKQS